MILRDFACTVCGHVLLDQWCDREQLSIWADCANCGCTATFEAVCNGGLKSRYRFADWPSDPEFYRGQVKAVSPTAYDAEGEPVRKYTSGTREIGAPMHEADKYQEGSDEREGKRDELQHATRRKRGTLPIVCDMGNKST